MDLSIRRVAKSSSLSGESFAEGELVESFLYRNSENVLERADLRASEVEHWPVPDGLLCRWRHRVRSVALSDSEARRQSVASAEEMFLAMVDAQTSDQAPVDPSVEHAQDPAVLLNLLALLLERKRVLKPVAGRLGRYYYGSEKRIIEVLRVDLEPLKIVPLLEELEALL